MATLTLTELLSAPVYDAAGARVGRVRELALSPQDDALRVSALIVKTRSGDRLLAADAIRSFDGGVHAYTPVSEWAPYAASEGLLLLERDLLDQQVIDVHGRKVVRVNDVDLLQEAINHHVRLTVEAVDIGARGALRRLLKGVVPSAALRVLLRRIPPKLIPWEFVDLIETDPSRRVKLKIELEGLGRLHPADIADIVEELAPAEREAVFETLDEEVAANALEEVEPKLQVSIVESLDSDRAADIVEEMQPDAAADLLADLPAATSQEILDEMEPEAREEVAELLEFREDTAAGRMTTEYLALPAQATVNDAIERLRHYEGGVETVPTIFLQDDAGKLVGAVPLATLAISPLAAPLSTLSTDPVISCPAGASEKKVAELFDKYNLLLLPVVDEQGVLTGVITADDIISLLRSKL